MNLFPGKPAQIPCLCWAVGLLDAGDAVGARCPGLGAQPALAGGTAVVPGHGAGGQGGMQPLFAARTHVATRCVAAGERDGLEIPPAEPQEQPVNSKPSHKTAVASSVSGVRI